MAQTPATSRQIPDHAILDVYNKQIYLGNQYCVNQAFTVGTGETGILMLRNINQSIALFQNILKVVENTAAHSIILNVYFNPTVAAGAQTVAFVADSSGSLNSTYFLLNDEQGNGYYVWFNINSAGVDPAVAGRTGIAVAGATNVTAATLGAAAKPLIQAANGGLSFSVSGTSTLTITNLIKGPSTPAIDGTAATGFTFAVTAGAGAPLTPINLRPYYGNSSIAQVSKNPIASANGSLVDSISSPAQLANFTDLLKVLDINQSLLVTSIASASSTSINAIMQWYEL